MTAGIGLLLVHAAATLVMTGVIWFVQIVHYPLFAAVGGNAFAAYQARHLAFTGRVVVPGMLVEAATAGILLAWSPGGLPGWMAPAGAILLGLIWLSTFLIQVPRHRVLESGFDPVAWRSLVATNWIRTVLWSLRGVLALAMIAAGTAR